MTEERNGVNRLPINFRFYHVIYAIFDPRKWNEENLVAIIDYLHPRIMTLVIILHIVIPSVIFLKYCFDDSYVDSFVRDMCSENSNYKSEQSLAPNVTGIDYIQMKLCIAKIKIEMLSKNWMNYETELADYVRGTWTFVSGNSNEMDDYVMEYLKNRK